MGRIAEAAITVSGLRKAYGGREVVRGVEFEVGAGEVFGFLGPNGAGKTTTIEILEGYRRRDGGTVEVLGRDPARADRGWRERVGLVLQECELEPLWTVAEAVSLFAAFYARPRDVEETIAAVGLSAQRDARIGSLSGGQKRRADVAIGIVGDPDLIFLDEPTTGLDPSARHDAWRMVEALREEGKTVFLTTHYMDEAQHLADRVAIIRDGEIAAAGTPAELGDRVSRRSRISFAPGGSLELAEIEAAVAAPAATLAGGRVEIESEDPQRDLGRLLALADSRQASLAELEVSRPNLEDAFLSLTGHGAAEADGGAEAAR